MSSLQSRTKVHSRINPSNEALVGATSKYELTSKKAVIPLHNKKNVRLQLDMTEPRPQDIPCHWQEDPIIAKLDDYNSAQRKSDFYVSCATTVAQVVDLVATTGIRDKEITHTVPRKVNLTCERRLGQDTHFEDGVIFDGPAEIGNDTKRISDLGRGAGGFVSLALYLPLLKLVAVKEITIRNAQEREMVKNELHALHLNLSHMDAITFKSRVQKYMHFGRELGTYRSEEDKSPFLVSFYGAYLTPSRSSISIVMDYMDMGSVQNMLDGPNGFTLSEDLVRHVAFCCVHALHSMHSKSMVHRDLKPANILLNRKGEFKVADFGLATTLTKSISFCSDFEGTMMYMSPERITGQPYSYSCDVWSLGVVLFCLTTGKYPFDTQDGFFGLEEAIVNDPLPPLPNSYSSDCRNFIKALLHRDPTKRLTAKEALNHPFLASYSIGNHQWVRFIELWQMRTCEAHLDEVSIRTIARVIRDESAQVSSALRPSKQHGPDSKSPSKQHGPDSKNLSIPCCRSKPYRAKSFFQQLAESCGVPIQRLHDLIQEVNDPAKDF